MQSRSVQPQANRVQQLEQALDQALVCLADLRLRLQDQQRLEIQLADTESYASMQQQAIVRLKLQISEQQQALDMQRCETQQRDQAIQELLSTIEGMTHAQQQQGERLRCRLAQDQQQVQSHRSRLGKHLQELQAVLESRQQRVLELEAEVLAADHLSARLQLGAARHPGQTQPGQTQPSQPQLIQPESGWQSSWPSALTAGLAGSLANSLDAEPQRIARLEQQIAEMQEQILQQAQQETEYETAVQYWKDRYLSLSQPSNFGAESTSSPPLNHAPELPPRLTTVELPEFLVRRRAGLKPEQPVRA